MRTRTLPIAILLGSAFMTAKLKAQDQPAKIKEFGIGLSNLNSFSLQYRWGTEKKLYRLNGTIGGTTAFGSGSGTSEQGQDTISRSYLNTTKKTSTPINFNAGLSFSILHIKQVNDKFGLICGPVAGINFITQNSQVTETGTSQNYNYYSATPYSNPPVNNISKYNSTTLQPFIGLVLGMVYKINASFLIYAEVAPNIYYSWNTSTNKTTDQQYYPTNAYINNSSSKSTNNTFGLASLSNSGAMLTLVYRMKR